VGRLLRVDPEVRADRWCDTGDVTVRVLVVDDHHGFRHQARLLMEEAGYDVVGEAGDAASAIGEARRLRPDVVLLDIQLPDSNGFDVAATLTSDDTSPVVVLVSGRDRADYAGRIAHCGARGFIAKADLSPETLHLVLAPGVGEDGTGR
jgi:DNA-binding NarL/FixJ family response regulator